MATTFQIGESTGQPILKPDFRGGVLTFGHVKAGGVDERTYDMLAEVISRIPTGYDFGSLRRFDFSDEREDGETAETVAITHLKRARRTEQEGENFPRGIQVIRVYTDLLSQLSEEAAKAVMAHELAHVWLNEHSGPEDSQKREAEADDLARRWGFGYELEALGQETEPVS